jgi:hypothetical protein
MHAIAHAGITLESIPAARPELVTGRGTNQKGVQRRVNFASLSSPNFVGRFSEASGSLAKWSTFTLGVDEINTHREVNEMTS